MGGWEGGKVERWEGWKVGGWDGSGVASDGQWRATTGLRDLLDALPDGIEILLARRHQRTPFLKRLDHVVEVQFARLHLRDESFQFPEAVFKFHARIIPKPRPAQSCGIISRR